MSENKSKRKKYFSSNLMMKKRRDLCLQPGLKGFISTTNGNEKGCIRESYNILNEYADKLYGEENKVEQKPESSDEKKDIMDEFKSELETLQAESSKSGGRRFQAINTGIFNCIFIKTNLDDPVALLDHVVKDLSETKAIKTRFLMRMIPVEVTCKAYIDEVKKAFAPLLDKYFKNEPTSFSIVFNRRNNSSLDRDIVIKELANLVSEANEDHKVNLTSASHTIAVEVMKNICCLSVVRDYFKYSKYNLNNICNPDSSVSDKNKNPNVEKPSVKPEDVDVSSSSGTSSNDQQNPELKTNSSDVSSTSGAKASETTVEIVPEVQPEPDTDANCKGEPAPKEETTVGSSVADEKL